MASLPALATGCSRQATPAKDEDQAKETFTAFEAAIKTNDQDKVWDLLSADSQKDADRAAQTLKGDYLKADAKEKAEQEKKLGLKADELAGLTGRLFLKSNRFRSGEIDELPGARFEKAVVSGDQATVHYEENTAKKDKETLKLVREGGKWKVLVPIRATP
jgi:hypothetical protein